MKIYKNPIPYKNVYLSGDENKKQIYSLEIAGSLQFADHFNPHFRNSVDVNESNRRDGKDIQDGIRDICEGIGDILEALRDLRKGRRDIEDGVLEIKEGLNDLRDGQERLAESEADIRDGVSDTKEGLKDILDSIDDTLIKSRIC